MHIWQRDWTATQSVKQNSSTATVYDPTTLLDRKIAQTYPHIKFYIGSRKISACQFLPPTGVVPSAWKGFWYKCTLLCWSPPKIKGLHCYIHFYTMAYCISFWILVVMANVWSRCLLRWRIYGNLSFCIHVFPYLQEKHDLATNFFMTFSWPCLHHMRRLKVVFSYSSFKQCTPLSSNKFMQWIESNMLHVVAVRGDICPSRTGKFRLMQVYFLVLVIESCPPWPSIIICIILLQIMPCIISDCPALICMLDLMQGPFKHYISGLSKEH